MLTLWMCENINSLLMMVVNFGLLGVFSSYYYVVFEPKLHESCLYVLILQVFASGEHANATQGRPEPRSEDFRTGRQMCQPPLWVVINKSISDSFREIISHGAHDDDPSWHRFAIPELFGWKQVCMSLRHDVMLVTSLSDSAMKTHAQTGLCWAPVMLP